MRDNYFGLECLDIFVGDLSNARMSLQRHKKNVRWLLSKPFQAEALEILIAWGEKRTEAIELIELACQRHPDVNSAEQLVPLVYRLKQGVEV